MHSITVGRYFLTINFTINNGVVDAFVASHDSTLHNYRFGTYEAALL